MSFLKIHFTVYDLIYIEYKTIFKKLSIFYINNNDYSILKDISLDNPLTFSDKQLISNIKNIPLKYFNINPIKKYQSNFSISYAFPFALTVYKDFIEYRDSKQSFFSSQDGELKEQISKQF